MGSKPEFEFKIEGVAGLTEAMRHLKSGALNRSKRAAVTAGARVAVKGVKSVAPERFKFLRRSQAFKVVTYDGGYVLAIIGTDKFKSYEGPEGREVPSNYDHLLHDGHINRDGGFTPGSPYIQIGVDITIDDQIAAMEAKFSMGINREAEKAAARAASKGRR